MIRQEKRKKLREYEKELKKIKNNRRFIRVINDPKIEALSPQEFDLLKEHTHKDKELQVNFDFGRLMLAKVKELEQNIWKLKTITK